MFEAVYYIRSDIMVAYYLKVFSQVNLLYTRSLYSTPQRRKVYFYSVSTQEGIYFIRIWNCE